MKSCFSFILVHQYLLLFLISVFKHRFMDDVTGDSFLHPVLQIKLLFIDSWKVDRPYKTVPII